MQRSPITTHVLDTARGCPASGVEVVLEAQLNGGWKQLGKGVTDNDGRIMNILPADAKLEPGVYRITFNISAYQQKAGVDHGGFYPYVPVIFEIRNSDQHYHVPLLLSPYGYSTYRGS